MKSGVFTIATSGLSFACLRKMLLSCLTLNKVISPSFLLPEVAAFTASLYFYPLISIILLLVYLVAIRI